MSDSGDILKVDQEHLETVIPALGNAASLRLVVKHFKLEMERDMFEGWFGSYQKNSCTAKTVKRIVQRALKRNRARARSVFKKIYSCFGKGCQ